MSVDHHKERSSPETAVERGLHFSDAIAALSEGVALFDAEDRLVVWNEAYRRLIETVLPGIIQKGISFEALIHEGAMKGLYGDLGDGVEAFVAERTRIHSKPPTTREYRSSEGLWLRASERSTDTGSIVITITDLTEGKVREEALALSEARFRSFAESTSDWFWEMDADLRFTYISGRYEELTGINPDTVIGKNRREFLLPRIVEAGPEEEDKWRRHFEDLEARRPFRDLEYSFMRSDGCIAHLRNNGIPVFDVDGTFRGYRGSVSDITALKIQEATLRATEIRYRNLFEESIQGTMIHRDFKVVDVNNAFAEMFGYESPDEVMALDSIWPLFGPGERERLEDYGPARARGDTVPKSYEFHGIRKDGSEIWLNNRPVLVDWEGGPAIMSAVVDVSALKERERELIESEAQTRLITDNVPVMIVYVDKEERYQFANKAVEQLYGRAASDIIGYKISDLLGVADYATVEPNIRAVLSGQYLQYETEVGYLDGVPRHMNLAYVPDIAESGEVRGYFGMGVDITESKRVEAELILAKSQAESADRAKSEFLANMSHELRTPLNAVLGFSQVMAEETFGPLGSERYKEYAEDILESGAHLLDLINDVLDLSRIEAGAPDLIDSDVNLNEVLRSMVHMMEDRAKGLSISIKTAFDPDTPVVRGDERAIKQIVLNLLSNSVKFTPAGGTLTVSSYIDPNGSVSINVADTGIGIALSDMERVMEPFGQVENAHTRAQNGTGLGLPLCKKLAGLHQASFELKSDFGVGTSANVRFPPERLIESPVNDRPV